MKWFHHFVRFVLNIILFQFDSNLPFDDISFELSFSFYFVCVCLFFNYYIYYLTWLSFIGIEYVKNSIKNILISFQFDYFDYYSFVIFFLLWFSSSWMNVENIWFLCYTYNYKICLVVQLNSFCFLKIMHMAMILMLNFLVLRRDFGYFVVLKISVILKEKIAFNFPSIFSWLFIFHLWYFFDLVFLLTIAILVWRFFVPGSGKKKFVVFCLFI